MSQLIRPGAEVSWFCAVHQTNSGHGVWRKAVVKRLTSHRVVIILVHPKGDELPHRTVSYGALELTFQRAEMHGGSE